MQATTDPAGRVALWERFSSKAETLGAVVERTATEAEAAELLLGAATPAFTRGLAERFPRVAEQCAPLGDPGSVAPDVAVGCVFALAETGSVLICEPNRDRAACFLAERLWLLVRADQIVPTVDEAFQQLGELIRGGARYATFMSGPSRSADIERTVTIGVHGPRALTIIVVGGEAV